MLAPLLPLLLTPLQDVAAPPPALRDAFGLAPFYQKHVSAGGLPIGSKRVSDHALLEARYLIDHMLEGRDDIRKALIANKVRVAVMAASEWTTDVPEHSDLRPAKYWNRRARGLGATRHRPATSCGEENLLGFPGDPYAAENILIHEFAHTMHHLGLSRVDRTFDRRLRAAYRAAKDKGLWKGTYASSNHSEYWAEAVQSWFDTNRPPDHDHNHVDTRAELRGYDPALAKLCEEVLGDRPWRYVEPSRRKARAHLEGWDPKKAPRFRWSKELLDYWREEGRRRARGGRAGKRQRRAPTRFTPDLSLLVTWSREAQRRMPRVPYAARYERDGKALSFVAARHGNRLDSPTFRVIEREFEQFRPEVVIIEGVMTKLGVSPQSYADSVKRARQGNRFRRGEPGFTASLALARKIPFIGGEPSEEAIRKEVVEGSIEERDLLYFYVLRNMRQWKRSGRDRRRSFDELFARTVAQKMRVLGLESKELADPKAFAAWYEARHGRPFVYEKFHPSQTAPITGKGAVFSNEMAVRVSKVREPNILRLIARLLDRHDRILVVYGSGHHVKQAKVLEKMLGKPSVQH